MSKFTNLSNKLNLMNFIKKKPFNARLITELEDQFGLTYMHDINDHLNGIGIELQYNGNGDQCGLLFINSINNERKNDSPIALYDDDKKFGYNIYIMPKSSFIYTIYNKDGQVTATVSHTVGLDSAIVQIHGSLNYYKIEGGIL